MRISVSDIDQWRWWKDHEEMELGELLARLRRQGKETEAMRAGTALHRALEHSQPSELEALESDGYRFTFECDCELGMPDCREVKLSKSLTVDGTPVTLVGVVDSWHGSTIEDHKATNQIDADRFMSSFQWRFYLWMFQARVFVWNIFAITPDAREPNQYRVREFQRLTQYAYPGMSGECLHELTEFVRFARDVDAYGTGMKEAA